MSNPYDNPMSNPYENQIGGDHYKKYKIQPSEFINKNKLLFFQINFKQYQFMMQTLVSLFTQTVVHGN